MMFDSTISKMELDLFRKAAGLEYSIGDLAAEIAFAAGFPAPAASGGRIAPAFEKRIRQEFGEEKAERFLIRITGNELPAGSLETGCDLLLHGAGVTPETEAGACATLLSGAPPSVHRVLEERCGRLDGVQTIFDVMQRERSVALLNPNGSAADKLFRWRLIEYYSMRESGILHRTVKSLMRENVLEGIVCFAGSETPEESVRRFEELAVCAEECWKDFRRVLVLVSGSAEGRFTVHGFRIRGKGKGGPGK